MKLRLLQEASADLESAAAFYDSRRKGLGSRLEREVDQVLALAIEYPLVGRQLDSPVAGWDVRVLSVRAFPIRVIYAVRGDDCVILAFMHTSRAPGYWTSRLARDG